MIKKIKTKEAFGYEWTKFGRINDLYDSENRLFDEFARYKIPESFFKDKIVLDAGCGMGRYSYVAAKLGAKIVIGIDIHDGVICAKENCKGLNAEFIKADIFNLPFKKNVFDSIMSIGVLHHTGDTHAAIHHLTETLKPGGMMFVQVYKKRHLLINLSSKIIKKITVRSKMIAYLFSYLLLFLSKIPLLRKLLPYLFAVSKKKPWKRALADIFDWYTAPITTFHDEVEMINYFKEADFEDIIITAPEYRSAVNIIGRKKV